jgi:hypothetical protein
VGDSPAYPEVKFKSRGRVARDHTIRQAYRPKDVAFMTNRVLLL